MSKHISSLTHIHRMWSRFTLLPRRCLSQQRFYSKEAENTQNEVLQNKEVKVNLDNSMKTSDTRPIDQRLQLHRLRNNFIKPGPGLKSAKNRNDLVAEFFDLSKSVMEGRLTVNQLKNSQTFLQLESELNFHVDIMSNSQVINIVASLIKMQFDPSGNMLRLLEHEVKFRINSLTLNQVLKLIKFYNAIETSYEQKQLTDILNNRLRSILLSNKTALKDLIDIYHHLAELNVQTNMLSLTEEKMLNILTDIEKDEDDVVSQYLPKVIPYDYNSLCKLFIELASVKRRPTPLLKAASQALHKTPLLKDKESLTNLSQLINVLSSLVSLNYTNRPLVAKLINDLTELINLNDLDSITQCNLLRTIGSLKWRPTELLEQFYVYIKSHKDDLKKVDHNVILTLFHITAHLNYEPDVDIKEFYNECMRGPREEAIHRNSRKWLNYVWSLAILNIATDEHFASVLKDDFIKAIENPLALQKMNHADVMKLLNLRTLARLEDRSATTSSSDILDDFAKIELQRGSDMQKFASKIKDALGGVVKNSEKLSYDRQTPFGFVVDCVLSVNSNSEIEAIDETTMVSDLIAFSERPVQHADTSKIALIYVLFDEALASHPTEPVGHKKVISRILNAIGFETVFVLEGIVNRYKTSADLSAGIQEMLKDAGTKKSEIGT